MAIYSETLVLNSKAKKRPAKDGIAMIGPLAKHVILQKLPQVNKILIAFPPQNSFTSHF